LRDQGAATVGAEEAAVVGAEGAAAVGATEERKEQPGGCQSSHSVEPIHSSNQTQALRIPSCCPKEVLPKRGTTRRSYINLPKQGRR